MNLHYIQHVPHEGLGDIEKWARDVGAQISARKSYADETLPNLDDIDMLVIMGGPMGVYDDRQYPWLKAEKHLIEQAISHDKIVLGVCLGAQLIAHVLGAKVYRNEFTEIGWFPIRRTEKASETRTGKTIPDKISVFHWHDDTYDLPTGAVHLARSEACENQAFVYGDRVLALQFHLEMTENTAREIAVKNSDQLVPGKYIQTAEEMLADPSLFVGTNYLLRKMLDSHIRQ